MVTIVQCDGRKQCRDLCRECGGRKQSVVTIVENVMVGNSVVTFVEHDGRKQSVMVRNRVW